MRRLADKLDSLLLILLMTTKPLFFLLPLVLLGFLTSCDTQAQFVETAADLEEKWAIASEELAATQRLADSTYSVLLTRRPDGEDSTAISRSRETLEQERKRLSTIRRDMEDYSAIIDYQTGQIDQLRDDLIAGHEEADAMVAINRFRDQMGETLSRVEKWMLTIETFAAEE